MERREAPPTEEGWYALHDLRTIDWAAWREAPEHRREQAIDEGVMFLQSKLNPETGDSALFAIDGHGADLLVVHFRPTLNDLNAIEREFERTALAAFTERADSFVSVTEVSGYGHRDFFEDDAEADAGMRRYVDSRLYPEMPDAEHVSFYPMDKRRGEQDNWYDLPFDERAEYVEDHGAIGKEYAGKVKQVITSAIGFDDWEWGVTLFANDPAEIKDLLYEMRFDPSSSRYAEFGPFYVGQRIPPADLEPLLAGERLPTGDEARDVETPHPESGTADEGEDGDDEGSGHGGKPPAAAHSNGGGTVTAEVSGDGSGGTGSGGPPGVREELDAAGVYTGQPRGEDVYAVVTYSEADPGELFEDVDGLRSNFDHYDTHVETAVYEGERLNAVASLWDTESAADTASGFLSDLPGVVTPDEGEDGWTTMGMFYSVVPEHREEFHDRFETVGELLAGMDGHRSTDLLVNREDENDMFIASQWDARDDALEFFRSEDFRDTVEWGREVLADRPRHVFLA